MAKRPMKSRRWRGTGSVIWYASEVNSFSTNKSAGIAPRPYRVPRTEHYVLSSAGRCQLHQLPMSRLPIQIGLERCLEEPPPILRGARFGLLMNQASVDGSYRYACDVLAERFPGQLTAIFSPQHGLWGEEQANMIESPHGRYEPL